VEKASTPNHIGIILDGNRRWAKAAGKNTLEGHRRGSEVFKELSIGLFERGVNYVSAFVFSTENWQRKAEEVDYLMRLVIKAVELHLDEYNRQNIRIRVLGRRDNLKSNVLRAIQRTEEKTADNDGGTLALCFNYGGKQEIVDSCKQLLLEGVELENLDEKILRDYLYAPEIPDIDLLIRTSGEQRLSGFMMWRAAYAELAFIDKYWPDMNQQDFTDIIENYNNRQRRFGC
jgi:undecaprenyl diphosphate synthase